MSSGQLAVISLALFVSKIIRYVLQTYLCELSDREVSDSALLTLTGHAGVLREWRFVVRRLGLKEADVLEVATSSGSLREQAYQALVTWRERNGNAGSGHALIKALKDCNLHAPAGNRNHISSVLHRLKSNTGGKPGACVGSRC